MCSISFAQTNQVLQGPAFDPPSHLSRSKLIQEAVSEVTKSLNEAIHSGTNPFGSFNSSTTSFSLTAASRLDSSPIIDFHHTSGSLNLSAGSTSKVTGDTVYRIGSVSKLFTVYALLLNNGTKYWNRPITDFIPELRKAGHRSLYQDPSIIGPVRWDQVTVGALASQLSGIGRDCNSADLAVQDFPWTKLGLPSLPPQDIPTCGINDGQLPCSRKEYFASYTQRHTVFPPYSKAMYSNGAYRILAYVLEAITGRSYEELVNDEIFKTLAMKHSSALPPTSKGKGVIPDGDAGWNRAYGNEIATGGLLSSSKDLVKFGRAIFSNKQLSPMETLRWMKPNSFTASASLSIGAPWEIVRTRSSIATGRIVDLYTKSGSVGAYQSLIILVPDYQVTLAVLAAGPDASAAVQVATETAIQVLLPALEEAAKEQACDKLCGEYFASTDASNSSLVITVDDSPGLLIKGWTHQGHDLIAAGQAYANATRGGQIQSVRLFPSGLQTRSRAAYRAIFQRVLPDDDASVRKVFDPAAGTWGMPDQLMYGGIAVDEFVFHVDAGKRSAAVEPRVLRAVYKRLEM
ncbi:beta-lactamase-like protein [Trichoderma parareesei]|uniref:Beta-lactamase-like protein n=1 Tax=Trichoderma parareesei TaxID=858221 RepID=A0A2H2ZPM5_TRIPA|nr:beta-lactamase-like protein [Trichoderma parareesei]